MRLLNKQLAHSLCGIALLFITALSHAAPTPPAPHPSESKSFYSELVDDPATVVTALATAIMAVFTGLLWYSTTKLWKESIRAGNISEKAANAAKKSAEIAERSLIDLEGPFLFPIVESNDVEESLAGFKAYPNTPQEPARPTISFRIKNFGRTHALPATMVAAFFYGFADDKHGDRSITGHTPESLIEAGGTSISDFQRSMTFPIDKATYVQLEKGALEIYLRGKIHYYDLFGNKYVQSFCLRWFRDPDAFMAWGPTRNRRERIRGSEQGATMQGPDQQQES